MAIFGLNDEIAETVIAKEDKSLVPAYESERIDERLVSTISGYSWIVTYFHRNVIDINLVTQFDPNLDPTIQDYIRIDDLEIKVDTPISSGTNELEGSGVIDIDFVPNPNDLFITKLPDGRSIAYVIRTVERFNYNKDNLFNITYSVYKEITDIKDEFMTSLIKSTTEELIYNKDYRINNTKPLFTKKEVKDREDLYNKINILLTDWTNEFIKPETKFYMGYRDKDNQLIFDPHMEDFIRDTIGLNNIPNKIEVAGVDTNAINLLTCLVDNNMPKNRILKYVTYVKSSKFGTNPYLFSLYYTGINMITTVTQIEDDTKQSIDDVISDIYPKIDNVNYIFRNRVYDFIYNLQTDDEFNTLTEFEKLFISTINGSTISKEDIDNVYEDIFNLPTVEKFYFEPILIYIIKYYITTFTVAFI